MIYKSFGQLSKDIWEWNKTLPDDFDLIVGIPRSGLLAANILALYRNLPLANVDDFAKGSYSKGGSRASEVSKIKKILVLDDTIRNGYALMDAKKKLKEVVNKYEISWAAVYADPRSVELIDFYFETIPGEKRVFQWNILNHAFMESSCVDIDGVLCRDPSEDENDDGEEYRKFILNVSPTYTPRFSIGYLVTTRLEKYRDLTKQWLAQHGIQYKELFMLNLPNKEERIKQNAYGKYKAAVYNSVESELFVESSHRQAVEILAITKKNVFSVERMEMLCPSNMRRSEGKWIRFLKLLKEDPKKAIKKAKHKILSISNQI